MKVEVRRLIQEGVVMGYGAFKQQTAPIDIDVMMLMPDCATMNPTRPIVSDLGALPS